MSSKIEIFKELTTDDFLDQLDTEAESYDGLYVEMDNKDGSKMKWYFKGRTDLDFLELGKAFWSKGS